MGRRSFALQTGIFISALAVGLVVFGLFLRGCNPDRVRYVVVADIPVTGLQTGSQLWYRGVNAGVVESIRVDPHNPMRALVFIEVDREIPITSKTFASLRMTGVTGTRVLDLDNAAPGPRLATSEEHPARIPMRGSFIDSVEHDVRKLMPVFQQLAQNLAELTGAENRARVAAILTHTERATARLDALEDQVERSLKGMPSLVAEGRRAAKHVGTLAEAATRLTTSTEQELQQRTLPRLNAAFERIGEASGSLERLSRELASDPRSLLLGQTPPPPGPGERGYRRRR